ncbi:hypothetical protein LSTR_LSTR015806 [Laodelphax striatellus]|uniref:Uncharacterized protein n=1 Tax=Laodelphax striatellus TaxID=195883 RepID=A0A482WV65_LAOST|nr:hypothetical protein LSTR_LSTR015806 [Laodelphax striatellus]
MVRRVFSIYYRETSQHRFKHKILIMLYCYVMMIAVTRLQFSRLNYRDTDTETNIVDIDLDQTQFRHHRVLRKRLEVVEMSSEALGQAQARLETKLQHLEHRIRLADDAGKEKFHSYEPSFEQRYVCCFVRYFL